jgi:hypothetical protein
MIVAGGGALWFVTERVWGKFFKVPKTFPESLGHERTHKTCLRGTGNGVQPMG